MSKLYIIIPARLKSKRLPHKILLNKTGKFLVMHTLEAALKSRYANDIFIATDSQEVVKKISPLYKKVFLTPETLTNGTERCLYLAQKLGLPNDAYIVNWQADEPELPAKYVDRLYKFIITTEYKVGTLAARAEKQYLNDPNTVKVVVNNKKETLFFFRTLPNELRDFPIYFHIGVYIYKLEFLQQIIKMKSTLEKTLNLEQMRILENGEKICILKIPVFLKGIDTIDDYKKFVKRQKGL